MFRANGAVKEQRAVDLLVIKGREEMNLITANHKQRHHLIAKYVHEPQAKAAAAEKAKSITTSKFLQDFFVSN